MTRDFNACENKGCPGIMETTRITCGADSGSEERCNKCGRTVEHGWGGARVRYAGRCQLIDGCALPSEHKTDCVVPGY